MNPIRKTKQKCTVCNQYIKVKYHNEKYDYCSCDNCNITFVKDHNTGKIIKAYVPQRELTI